MTSFEEGNHPLHANIISRSYLGRKRKLSVLFCVWGGKNSREGTSTPLQ